MNKTTEARQAALARSEELVVKELPDELLVYDLTRHKAHCLNKTSAFIWNHCDGKTPASEIAELMQKGWNTPVSEGTVWFALDKLGKAGLLQEPIVLPKAQAGMSRRSAIRRLGVGALLVPVVMTIVAPTALAQASSTRGVPPPPPPCTVCNRGTTGGCDPACTPAIIGTCFKNDSCPGVGDQFAPQSCASCFATGGKSWRA